MRLRRIGIIKNNRDVEIILQDVENLNDDEIHLELEGFGWIIQLEDFVNGFFVARGRNEEQRAILLVHAGGDNLMWIQQISVRQEQDRMCLRIHHFVESVYYR